MRNSILQDLADEESRVVAINDVTVLVTNDVTVVFDIR